MRLEVLSDEREIAQRIADLIDAHIGRRRAVLGVATGKTFRGTYAELLRRQVSGISDYSSAHLVLLDEYLVNPPHRPYRQEIVDLLARPLGIADERVHSPEPGRDPDRECRGYERLLADLGGVDLQLLGIGRNGHIGFNEPGTAFTTRTHVARLSESTRDANSMNFATPEAVPRDAITQGIATILDARCLIVAAIGPAKAGPVRRLLDGDADESLPASAMLLHPNATLIVDRSVVDLLTSPGQPTTTHQGTTLAIDTRKAP